MLRRSSPPFWNRSRLPPETEPSPEVAQLRAAIEQLPTKQRQVILMHYLEETSVKEVAILLEISAKTVEGRLYQARRDFATHAGWKSFLDSNWKDIVMSVELVSESDLRAALRPHRVNANEFAAGIQTRIEAGVIPLQDESSQIDDPLLTVAATFIPWPLITGGKIAGGGTKLSSLTLAQKLLGYAALPAISLFLLVGATFFSARKIHKVQKENQSDINDAQEMQTAARQWWRSHRFGRVHGICSHPHPADDRE